MALGNAAMVSRSGTRREKHPESVFITNEVLTIWCADESHLQFTIHRGNCRNRTRNKPSRAYQHRQATIPGMKESQLQLWMVYTAVFAETTLL
jgi:hypothetical protein